MPRDLVVKPARVLDWPVTASAEASLIERCLTGDETACTALVDQHQRMVYQLALHLLGDPQEALDLSQDVFLRVFRTIHTFRGQSTLRTWIYRIVINQARNRLRWWRRRRRDDQVSLDEHLNAHGDVLAAADAVAPDQMLRQKELGERLRRALDALPFEQRSALVLREIEGLSYEEIAYSLGVRVGTVKSRLARAREALRAELKDLWTC